MENIDTFEEFLKKKVKEKTKKKKDWVKRKNDWLDSIDKLYSQIKEWLAISAESGLLQIKDDKKVDINEEFIGQYQVHRLDIYIGTDLISLTPKGSLIIGSYGRIDITGPKGEYMMIEPEWNKWKFAKRMPKLKTWDINEKSFKKIIQELV